MSPFIDKINNKILIISFSFHHRPVNHQQIIKMNHLNINNYSGLYIRVKNIPKLNRQLRTYYSIHKTLDRIRFLQDFH